jgi:hypothetical protein
VIDGGRLVSGFAGVESAGLGDFLSEFDAGEGRFCCPSKEELRFKLRFDCDGVRPL